MFPLGSEKNNKGTIVQRRETSKNEPHRAPCTIVLNFVSLGRWVLPSSFNGSKPVYVPVC